jgi:hypothetical protein
LIVVSKVIAIVYKAISALKRFNYEIYLERLYWLWVGKHPGKIVFGGANVVVRFGYAG